MKILRELGWIVLLASILIMIPFKVIGPLQQELPNTEAEESSSVNESVHE
ncbi:hypothetical protein [Sediminibacillus halophilus]|uniref:Uncharacterized protein n=1 Tax=Sediminibacillus halophilus TaxID=482461 RepID=A0A1G9VEH9_9BACI|nr:hypothetical protein [Sediminibacillus halophilus]SDM70622.1 hypothetical protein SAMN05216244_3254 [Sediminibacillus halophilus]